MRLSFDPGTRWSTSTPSRRAGTRTELGDRRRQVVQAVDRLHDDALDPQVVPPDPFHQRRIVDAFHPDPCRLGGFRAQTGDRPRSGRRALRRAGALGGRTRVAGAPSTRNAPGASGKTRRRPLRSSRVTAVEVHATTAPQKPDSGSSATVSMVAGISAGVRGPRRGRRARHAGTRRTRDGRSGRDRSGTGAYAARRHADRYAPARAGGRVDPDRCAGRSAAGYYRKFRRLRREAARNVHSHCTGPSVTYGSPHVRNRRPPRGHHHGPVGCGVAGRRQRRRGAGGHRRRRSPRRCSRGYRRDRRRHRASRARVGRAPDRRRCCRCCAAAAGPSCCCRDPGTCADCRSVATSRWPRWMPARSSGCRPSTSVWCPATGSGGRSAATSSIRRRAWPRRTTCWTPRSAGQPGRSPRWTSRAVPRTPGSGSGR